ncbi:MULTISPECIES: hypothetical protein [unclassified Micromonospora]|uniref:hypothetical protein n=1 Tax=unclassified Micromonospora TaxID=2617518 RepID=UPI00332429E9
MRDETTFVDQLHRELRDVRWPEPAEIRARARRRSRRTALGAAAVTAVTVLTVAASGMVDHVDGDRPLATAAGATAARSDAPVRAAIPMEALLQPEDLPEKETPRLTVTGIHEPIRIDGELTKCLRNRGLPAAAEPSRYSRSQTVMGVRPPGEPLLRQDLYRVRTEEAGKIIGDIDRQVNSCPEWETVGVVWRDGRDVETVMTHRWQVVARGFAGDESALLRQVMSEPRQAQTLTAVGDAPKPLSTAFVRVGDLVTVVSIPRDSSEAELRRLAAVAATRMCVAANPPC